MPPVSPLPALDACAPGTDLLPLRLAAISALVETLRQHLDAEPLCAPGRLEDFAMRHLAKAAGSTRAALRLIEDGSWGDACILARAVFEQLFTFLWVMQDAARAEARSTMVTIKQEWANAKYLEGLALNADAQAQQALLAEAAQYRAVADALLAELAAELGMTEKKVRDEATLRVSAKAVEVNLGPRFSIPYAYFSGFAHSDGNALAGYGDATPEGTRYTIRSARPALPLASDLHRALLRMCEEVRTRCPRVDWPQAETVLAAHSRWLAEADARERPGGHDG